MAFVFPYWNPRKKKDPFIPRKSDPFVPRNPFVPREDLGFFDKVSEAYSRGKEQALTDVALYRALRHGKGNIRQVLARRDQLRRKEQLEPIDGSTVADMFYGGSRVAGQMLESVKAGGKTAAVFAGAGAAGGAIAGLVLGGPTGEEPLTAAGGAMIGLKAAGKLGLASGAAIFSYEQGAGEMLGTMMDAGYDPEKSMLVAQIAGVPYALLEMAQVKAATPLVRKGLGRILNRSFKNIMKQAGKKYVKTLTAETAQELGQEAIQIIAEDTSKYLSGHGIDLSADIVKAHGNRMLATAIESAKSFALIPAPGAAIDVSMQIGPGTWKIPTDKPNQIIATPTEEDAGWSEEEFRVLFLEDVNVDPKEKQIALHLIDRGVTPSEAMATIKSLKNTHAETISHKEQIREEVDEIVDTMSSEHKGLLKRRPIGGRASRITEFWDGTKDNLSYYHWGMIRIGRLFEWLDGKANGPLTRFIWQPMRVAVSKSAIGRSQRIAQLENKIQSLGLDLRQLYNKRITIDETLKLTPNDMLEVYIAGRDKEKLRNVRARNGNNFSKKQITKIRELVHNDDRLTNLANWLLYQYSSDAAEITDKHYKTTGKLLKTKEGYSPIRRRRKGWARFLNVDEEFNDLLHTKILGEGIFTKRREKKPFVRLRTKAIGPLNLDALGNYVSHVRAVEHYKAVVIPAYNTNRLLSDHNFIRVADKLTRGAGSKILTKWLGDVASERTSLETTMLEHILGVFRRNAVTAALGLNIVTALKQPLSISLALAENPAMIPHFFKACADKASDFQGFEKFVHDRSTVVKHRNMEREMREMAQRRKVRKQILGRRTLHEKSLFFLRVMDQGTVQVMWKSAYDLALEQSGNEQVAITYADSVIERTQPMADIMDLPHFYRGSEWHKMLTLFTNQINQNYNYWAHDILGSTTKLPASLVAYRVLMSILLPATLLGLVSRGFNPGDPKEWTKDLSSYLISPFFVVGKLISAMIQGFDPSTSLTFNFAGDFYNAYRSKTGEKKLEHILGGTAKAAGVPWNQPKRSLKGLMALQERETKDIRELIWSKYALRKKKK